MLKELRRKMSQEGIKTLCITDKYNFLYVFGVEISGYAFITQKNVEMILPRFYRYENISQYDPIFAFCRNDYEKAFERTDYETVYAEDTSGLEEHFDVEKTNIVKEMRKRKNSDELKDLKKAAEITDKAIQELKPELIGLTEFEAVNRLQKFYSDRGFQESFLTDGGQSLVQRNCLRPHRPPENKKIRENDMVIVDTGARVNNYCGDITRTFCNSPDERQQELFDAVKDIQSQLIGAIEAGMPISEWKKREFELVEKQGFNVQENVLYFGHGLGLNVHESPTLTHSTDEKFKEGMVVTVEPGLHVEGLGGVRIEDMVYIEGKNVEVLSSSPRTL